jgi:DNA-directed RNA polymerase subunit RPC12/RpoP
MNRRIGRYLHRNRQAEDDDLKQEFMIGVALNISKAKLDIGDPIEYIVHQGVYRVRTYLRKHILQGTTQVCEDCGYETRLNRVGNYYICRKCGSNHIITRETNDYDEITLMNVEDKSELESDVVSKLLMEEFEHSLNPDTNVYQLYILIRDGINRDNPQIKNYIKEIATIWGGCSQQNVVQVMDKLKLKLQKFATDNSMMIINNQFFGR